METQQSAKEHQTESQTQIKAKGCRIIASQKSGDAKSKKNRNRYRKSKKQGRRNFKRT